MNKGIIVAISIVVILIAVFVITTRGSKTAGPPSQITGAPVTKVDKDSLEVVTLPMSEWQKLGANADGCYKNPTTGQYTMLPTMTCKSCGATIPTLLQPPSTGNDDADEAAYAQMMNEYKCPKCGKNAFGMR